MAQRKPWKTITPSDVQEMTPFERQDLFNNLQKGYRAASSDRNLAYELPRLERVLGFLGAKKDRSGNWIAPDFETAPTETGGDEVYKAARQMEADRRKKMEEEAAAERARPAETMSFDPVDVFGLTPEAKARRDGPAEPMVFNEPLDIFGKMPSAPAQVETAETWKFDPIDVLGRKGFEGPAVEDMPGDENSGYSMSFPPLDILGGKNPFKEGELEREYNQKVKADEDLLKNTEVGFMGAVSPERDAAFKSWLSYLTDQGAAQQPKTLPEATQTLPKTELDFGEGLDLTDAATESPSETSTSTTESADSSPIGRPQDYENPLPYSLDEELMGSSKLPITQKTPLLNAEGIDTSDAAFKKYVMGLDETLSRQGLAKERQEEEAGTREWLKKLGLENGISSSGAGAHSADLRNEMQAFVMAKAGLPYSPQTTMRQMARSGGAYGVKGNLTPGQMLTQQRHEQDRVDRQGREAKRDAREDARIGREDARHRSQQEFREKSFEFKKAQQQYKENEDNEEARRKMMARAEDLRKEFNALPETKTMTEVSRQYENLKSGLSKGTGAGDQAAIMSFNKMMDPGSVVRESEYATTAEGAGLLAKMESMFKFYSGSGRLNETARKQLLDSAQDFYAGANSFYRNRLGQYQAIASEYDIDPKLQKSLFPSWFGGVSPGQVSEGTEKTDEKPDVTTNGPPVKEPPKGIDPVTGKPSKKTEAMVRVTRTKNGKTETKSVSKSKLEGMRALGWKEMP